MNILEYKNPKDDLNERVLWKAIGYAGLYISDKGVDAKDVTITLFREKRNKEFFERLAAEGNLSPTETRGIYTVKGVAGIESRIILTGELEGPEYVAYRALSSDPAEDDLKALVREAGEDKRIVAYVRVILNHTATRHPELIERVRREKGMNEAMMAIFKDEIEKSESIGEMKALDKLVQQGIITIEQAAVSLSMTTEEFQAAVEQLKVTA